MNVFARIGSSRCAVLSLQRVLRFGHYCGKRNQSLPSLVDPHLLHSLAYPYHEILLASKYSTTTENLSKVNETDETAKDTKDVDRFGIRLQDLLHHSNDKNDLVVVWRHYGDVFRHSLQELRILRARGESQVSLEKRLDMILDSLVLLDQLSESLPRAEDYSSSWLSSNNEAASSEAGSLILDQGLFNEFLKEWMMGWKEEQHYHYHHHHQQQQQQQSYKSSKTLLPTPTQMAERIDAYRSRCLVQPDPTCYNLLLNAMIYSKGGSIQDRRKAILLADDYLRRLLQAQQSTVCQYVDTVSVTTVMKSWVDLGQPRKAQDWLDLMEENIEIPPNAVAYSILIHGYAKRGDALAAESILERALEYATTAPNQTNNEEDCFQNPLVDRVVFHAVLDAWAAKAGARGRFRGNTNSNSNDESLPSLRAKALVQRMNDLADKPWFEKPLRPNDETWHKLIAVVASSSQSRSRTKSEEVGPRAAERLLLEMEETKRKGNDGSYLPYSSTPAVLLNRILQAYCSCGRQMEEAEAFYHRRCQLIEQEQASLPKHERDRQEFPNEITFHTILNGWATVAKATANMKKKNTTKKILEIPLRTEAWLDILQEQHGRLSTRAYGSVLQAWSLSTKHHSDAAERAEYLLRNHVWPLLQDPKHVTDHDLAKGVVICTNIVLRAWSNQTAATLGENSNSVTSSLRLLNDFLELLETSKEQHGIRLQPTEETFRAVLHAIATPSKCLTPVQKHDHAKAIFTCMKETFRLQPSKGDLSKFERLKQRRDDHFTKDKR